MRERVSERESDRELARKRAREQREPESQNSQKGIEPEEPEYTYNQIRPNRG